MNGASLPAVPLVRLFPCPCSPPSIRRSTTAEKLSPPSLSSSSSVVKRSSAQKKAALLRSSSFLNSPLSAAPLTSQQPRALSSDLPLFAVVPPSSSPLLLQRKNPRQHAPSPPAHLLLHHVPSTGHSPEPPFDDPWKSPRLHHPKEEWSGSRGYPRGLHSHPLIYSSVSNPPSSSSQEKPIPFPLSPLPALGRKQQQWWPPFPRSADFRRPCPPICAAEMAAAAVAFLKRQRRERVSHERGEMKETLRLGKCELRG